MRAIVHARSYAEALAVLSLVSLAAAACTDAQTPAPLGGQQEQTPPTTGKPATPPNTGPADPVEQPTTPATCTGNPGELYELTVKTLASLDDLKLCTLKGSALLIVNGASGCGYTPQYTPLQTLYKKYKDTQKKPFEVLAFPSRSFNQEKETDAEVSAFCTKEYHITFPLFTIGPVIDNTAKNETAQPIYQWIYAQPGMSAPVAWNFEKFLISKEGKVVKRWPSAVSPNEGGEIDLAIAAELAK